MSESFAALFEESLKRAEMRSGEVITAEVVRIDHNHVVVNAGLKSEGIVPIEQFRNEAGEIDVAVGDVVKEGEDVEVKILSIDKEAQRIALSLKATLPEPEAAKAEEAEETPGELVVAKRTGPLKGGFDRPTGGEGVGLNW